MSISFKSESPNIIYDLIKIDISFDDLELSINNFDILNYRDENGSTPLMLSIHKYAYKWAEYLTNHPNININLENMDGSTALHFSCSYRYMGDSYVKLLMSRNDLLINKQDNNGWSALMYAIKYKNIKVVSTLLTHKDINLNLKNNNGDTIIDYIIKFYDFIGMSHEEREIIDIIINHPNLDEDSIKKYNDIVEKTKISWL